jgi:predicted GNAT family acetyltransferase
VDGGSTPNGRRVGAVYTPLRHRRRGYATALVASLSQVLLDGGAKACFLFTDLANPVSNSIYAKIGYRPVADIAEIDFIPGGIPEAPR